MTDLRDTTNPFHGFTGAIWTPEIIERQLVVLAIAASSVITAPVELLIRPKQGTRYNSPITFIPAWLIAQVVLIVGFAAESFTKPSALMGAGLFYIVFYAGLILHARRMWFLMNHMDLEKDSLSEGPALPFLSHLPGANWFRLRIFYEPALVIAAALLLYFVHVITATVAIYVLVAGAFLPIKNVVRWYDSWLFWRVQKDSQGYADRLKSAGSAHSGDTVGRFVLAAMPADATSPERAAAIGKANGVDAAFGSLITPTEPAV